MKIEGPRAPDAASGPRKSNAASGAGFALPEEPEAPAAASSTAAARPAPAIGALLALQVEGYDPNRRGRQVRRGQKTLEALEAIAEAHLSGEAPNAAQLSLVALQAQSELTGDPGLDAVMADIDVRAAVELAKLEVAAARMRG